MTNQAETIKATCLRLLARREHSHKELLTKLQLKGFSPEDCTPIIEQLTQQNWQSDARYAESYARHRIQQGYGPIAIKFELSRNGITDFNLDAVVSLLADSWQTHLQQVYVKKYRNINPLNASEYAKRSRFLLQRGFPSSMVNQLLTHLNQLD
ncbi:MAG: recombination regulator RecX [Methylovulum sp.]|nr:recombination regulator RecX [Methylovulum sp.]MCF7997581.1 recombination regulator RecX [Methylovulum sp.]